MPVSVSSSSGGACSSSDGVFRFTVPASRRKVWKLAQGIVRVLKELLGHLERRPDVPGDEVHIAAEKAGGSAGEGEDLRAVASG